MEYPIPISVVMPTYNTPLVWLKEAVESVLNQTFKDFEFIIVDDCSTDESVEYLKGLTDERVRIVRNATNLGVTKSLNVGLDEARGKYIARMDADDVSLPWRFEKQYRFMEAVRDAIICGTKAFNFVEDSEIAPFFKADYAPPKDDGVSLDDKVANWFEGGGKGMELYKITALFSNPGPDHPTLFIDREKLMKSRLRYNEELCHAQDYGLFAEAYRFGTIYKLKEILVCKRRSAEQVSVARRDVQILCDKAIQKKLLSELLGDATEDELEIHCNLPLLVKDLSPEIVKWLKRLVSANEKRRVYDQELFRRYVVFLKERIISNMFQKEGSKLSKLFLLFRFLPPSRSASLLLKYLKDGSFDPKMSLS